MEIRFNVRTAAKRRADFGEDKKIWRTLIAEANSPLKKIFLRWLEIIKKRLRKVKNEI